jgi:predicted transcriptional regulator
MFKIKIQSMGEMWRDVEKSWKLTSEGKTKHWPDELTLSFDDLSMVAKVLSKERLRLLQIVKEKKPASVNQLAILLGRSQQNVHKDVHYLAELGILDLKKNRKKGSKKEAVQPEFHWDGFAIAV